MQKIYRTISSVNLTRSVWVGNKEHILEFRGGSSYPIKIMGRITVYDEQLQKAIESSSAYGVDYIEIVSKQKDKKKAPKTKLIEGIKTKQMVLNWIEDNLNKKFPVTVSDEEVREYLFEKGYVMINWQRV